MLHPVVLILGPTAAGKTRLAIDLALALRDEAGASPGAECICADSMQVYRGMDIGTAKPTPEEQAEVPHHLLDIAEPASGPPPGGRGLGPAGRQPTAPFSVETWLRLAEQTICDIRGRGRYPFVVGGTNLYIQALLFGLIEGPEPDPALRGQLAALSDEQLRRRLEQADPATAGRIHLRDRKRAIRAIEVFEKTGQPLSEMQWQWEKDEPRRDVIIIGLDYAAEAINRRINARVKAMMAQGLLDEVRALHVAGRLGPQAREALGYKQLIDHLEDRCTLEEAVEQIKIRTRRYAKQQRTWLRRFRTHQPSLWLDAADLPPDDLTRCAAEFVHRCAPHH